MSFGDVDELEDVLKSTEDSDKLDTLAFSKEGNKAEDLAKLKDEGMYVIDDKDKDTLKEKRMAGENEAKDENNRDNKLEINSNLNVKNVTKDDLNSKVDQDVFETIKRAIDQEENISNEDHTGNANQHEGTGDSDKLENLAFLKKGNTAEDRAKLKDEGMYLIDDRKPNVKDTVKEERMAGEIEAKDENIRENKIEINSKVDQNVFETIERAIDQEENIPNEDHTVNANHLEGKIHFATHSKENEIGQTWQASVSTEMDSPNSQPKLPGQPAVGDIPSSTLKAPVYTRIPKQKVSAQKFPCFLPNKTQREVTIIVYDPYSFSSVFI